MAGLTITRNNNPGALRKPGSLEFQRFASEAEGITAQEQLLQRYHKAGRRTVSDIIERYAPRKRVGGDNTDEEVNNYIHYVAQRMGVNPKDTLAPTVLPRVAGYMREFETGRGKNNKIGPAPKGDNSLTEAAAMALGVPLRNYTVAPPAKNEGSVQATAPSIDTANVQTRAQSAVTTSDRYSQFLQDAVGPIVQNTEQQLQRQQAIVGIKRNIVNDFATREAALEQRIRPLMAQREQLAARMLEVDNMDPLSRRFKSIFNPREYDPRILRGRLERIDTAIGVYESNYTELNKLRSGVAAASVDAESADATALELARQSTLAAANLFGQVAGAVKTNATDQLLPLATHVDTLRLQEFTKASLLGKLTLERTVDLYNQAQSSPDGKVTIDGVTLTLGDLQTAARAAQGQDITWRNMINAYKVSDINTVEAMESNYIEHMSPEQINEALKHEGKITGADGTTYQLSITKLAQAAVTSEALRTQQVNDIIGQTIEGQMGQTVDSLGPRMKAGQERALEMFGTIPGDLRAGISGIMGQFTAWKQGLDHARQQGTKVAEQYIVQTQPQWSKWHGDYDQIISRISNQWGGGKKELSALADSYLRGNPLSGDSALKGLIVLSRSGMPAGAQLSGPAAQAFQVARSTVLEWDNPQAGDSLEVLMRGGKKNEADLLRLVQQRVSSVYADSIADEVIKSLPQLSRGVRDPNNPNRLHPFARVSQEDFILAVRHGDASAYNIVANKMGIDPNKVKRVFSSGTDSPEWQTLAKEKGWSNSDFADFYQSLQALQMSETLSALDASHSAAPGFSPAQAYISFLQTPEVQNKVNQLVQNYGQSNFGSFIISSSAGGGFKDSWDSYTQSLGAVYQQQHSKELRQRIQEQRSIVGDPWIRMNAVNRAAGLNPQESQTLLQAIKPLVTIQQNPDYTFAERGMGDLRRSQAARNFDNIAVVIRNHKFDDPALERLRRRVDSQWDAMEALVGTVFESVND